MNSINQILQEAIRLPEDQRLTLVNRLLTFSEPHASDDVRCAWDEEILEFSEKSTRHPKSNMS